MRRPEVLLLGLALTHTIVVTALSWPEWGHTVLALICWMFAALGAAEPTPTRSGRHRDVQAAERTTLGQHLLYREGWILERPVLCMVLIVVISLLAAATVVGLARVEATPLLITHACVWAPAVLLGGGCILSQMVNMWVVTGPLLALWLLAVVASLLGGEWMILARAMAGGVGVIAAVFCVDLLRGARRGLERAASPSTPRKSPVA